MYQVRATRWARGWELAIDGVGVTQSATLNEAEGMVRDYLAADGYADAATAELRITAAGPREVTALGDKR